MTRLPTRTLFERAILASGLVDPTSLDVVADTVAVPPSGAINESQAATSAAYDTRLALALERNSLLNSWQIDQLREGRTKFTLGPYLILDAIGKGGMGHVFKGEHQWLGRPEAIKVLPRSKSSPATIANFRHEIRAQAQLDHPNLVRVSFADQDGETYYFVTEFVPGVDLRRLVRRCGALTSDQAACLMLQAAEGLDYAHRRGLVHRDVKPGNLLVTPKGVVKVTDLGLAWFLNDASPDLESREGKVVGTCDYLAPESIRHPDRIVPVSDVYSLGCTLYYAATGKVPFPGGNAMDKMRRHGKEKPLDPRSLNPSLDEDFVELIQAMMNKDPLQRTPSAAAVAEQLEPFVLPESKESIAHIVAEAVNLSRTRTTTTTSGNVPSNLHETMVDPIDELTPSPDGGSSTVDTEALIQVASESMNDPTPPRPIGQQNNAEQPEHMSQETMPFPYQNNPMITTGELSASQAHVAVDQRIERFVRGTVAVALTATVAILLAVVWKLL